MLCQTVFLCLVHFAYGGLLAKYNENGSTCNVKVMSHANMLLWAMDHPPPTNMYVVLTLQDGAFKEMVHQLHARKYDISVADLFPKYFFLNLFIEHSQQQHQQFKCSATTIMAIKISNAMLKIEATKNIILFPIIPSLKNVATSLSNEL